MNIQQIIAQIAELQDATMDENKNFRTAYDEGKFDALSAVDALLDSLQEEPVSKDLEEAAVFYANTHTEWFDHEGNPHVAPAFKAGAEWMASQGAYFEDVIEMCYCNKKPMGLSGDNISITKEIQTLMQSHGIGDGDKVIIQIRKK